VVKNYEIKNISDGVKDVDTSSRRVKVAISQIGSKDLDSDVIDAGAYNKTIKERGPKGSNLIWHLTDHNASLKSAIGKFSELSMEGDYLVGVTNVPNTTIGNDMMALYADGHINQHSVGFRTIKSEPVNADKNNEYRLIKEILLYEGSAVLWGANPNTPTLSVGKDLNGNIECPKCHKHTKDVEAGMGYYKCSNCNETFNQSDLAKAHFDITMDELGKLHKMFKTGHLSDQSYELIEMKISQLTDKLQQLFIEATQPAVKAVEPEENGLLDVFKTFNNKLNGKTDYDTRRIESAA
jgi:HK97 family phage prohead protease